LPSREDLLEELPKGAIVAEVGAAFGDFSKEILQRVVPEKLHLVDPWHSQRYESGMGLIEEKFSREIAAGVIVLNRGLSVDILPTFPDNYFDVIYIDTDHTYETTLAELRLSEKKLKPGGLLTGHDFCIGNIVSPWPYGVIGACHQFCVENNWGYRYLTLEHHGHYSFGLARLSEM
jgi:predicted O-methyltransferase YrrM